MTEPLLSLRDVSKRFAVGADLFRQIEITES